MRTIITETTKGPRQVPVYEWHELPYTEIMLRAQESKKRGKYARAYLEIPCAFDIETTNIYRRITSGKDRGKIDPAYRPFAFMYHWQLCIGYRVIFGRTWREFTDCLTAIRRRMNLSARLRLVIYVHNLPFEMQFMRRFLRVTESFCKDDRHPLYVVHDGCIEFRCSAALSNMSLQMFCKNEGASYYKMVDTYDYSKIRTPETKLTESEESYCYNDVRGLSECIQSLMRYDTLSTIPLTSTGYVRRDARIEMKKNKKNRRIFRDSALSPDLYRAMRAAFRGGDTHAAARYANQVLTNVESWDMSSAYPASMMMGYYPMSAYTKINLDTMRMLRERDKNGYTYLMHIKIQGAECVADHGMPYIPLAKTKSLSSDRVLDNGRIKKADELTMWVLDDDFDIILDGYKIDSLEIESVFCAVAAQLPEEYKKVVMDYFRAKTRLKGKQDAESIYLYNKAKNRLNSLFGMMCQRIDMQTTEYTGGEGSGYVTSDTPLEALLDKYYKGRNNFLCYQWGCKVTSLTRKRLHDFLSLIGSDVVYSDTDSGKILRGPEHRKDIDNLNNRLREEAIVHGAFADDPAGERHYLGVFERDGIYDEFKTLGAKKYVVSIDGECYSTIAGVNKKAGQKFFNKRGIDAFEVGAVIEDSGHLVAYYNDDEVHEIEVDGVRITTASNVALVDDTYTVGVTGDYASLLRDYQQKIYS